MKDLSLRFCLLASTILMRLSALAAPAGDQTGSMGGRGRGDDFESMYRGAEGGGMHFDIQDIILMVVLLAACYIFGKIWKGCSYLLLIVAAIIFYMAR